MRKIRFSLMTLLLMITAIASAIGVWFHWKAWDLAYRIDGVDNVVCFSDDCSLVVTMKNDTACIIETATGKERFQVTLEEGDNQGSFSPDGRILALNDTVQGAERDERIVRLWDVTTGKPLHVLKGNTLPTVVRVFTPDSRFLLTRSCGNPLRIWDVSSGSEKAKVDGGFTIAQSSISPDSRQCILSVANKIVVIDLQSGTMREISQSVPNLGNVQYLSDGRILANVFVTDSNHVVQNMTLHLCDTKSMQVESKPVIQIPEEDQFILCNLSGFITETERAVITIKGEEATVWEPLTGRVRGRLPNVIQCQDTIAKAEFDLTLSASGAHVIGLAHDDGKATIVWDVASGTRQRLDGQEFQKMSPNDRKLFTLGAGAFLNVWMRNHPEGRFGILGLPELWVLVLSTGALFWRLGRWIFRKRSVEKA